jgi:hypothetical protein
VTSFITLFAGQASRQGVSNTGHFHTRRAGHQQSREKKRTYFSSKDGGGREKAEKQQGFTRSTHSRNALKPTARKNLC